VLEKMITYIENSKPKLPKYTDLPDNLVCPIMMELMQEPVIISSGHSFEK